MSSESLNMSDVFTIVSKIPTKFRWYTPETIVNKIKQAEKAAVLFFYPSDEFNPEDMLLTVFFLNGYKFIKEAELAIVWKLKAGNDYEKTQAIPLYELFCDVYADYYTGFD